MGKRATILGDDGRKKPSMTDTTVVRFSTQAEMHVPGWDLQNGGSATNRMERLQQRAELGQKKTPLGRGTTVKRWRG